MPPTAPAQVVRELKRAAGRKLGHDVEVRWDEFAERWVIYTFDKRTARVDNPWMVVQNEDGTYRPLDSRAVEAARKYSSSRMMQEQLRHYKRDWERRLKITRLLGRQKMLKAIQLDRWRRGEPSPKIDRMIDANEAEILEFEKELGGHEAFRELAAEMVRALRGRRVIALS